MNIENVILKLLYGFEFLFEKKNLTKIANDMKQPHGLNVSMNEKSLH